MIYKQTGYRSNVLSSFNTDKKPLEVIANTFVPTIEANTNIKSYKAKEMLYFISGDITPNEDGSYTRNDNNLKSRDLIVIDIEDTGLTSEKVQAIIQERLSNYKYLLYSSISHKPNNPRLRLVIEPDREILKEEYKPTIQHIMALLQLNYDKSSSTWSQLQGLPIAVRDNEHIFIKKLDGLPYPVQEASKEEKKVIINYHKASTSTTDTKLSDEDFKELFLRYLELDYVNIHTKDSEEYNRALGILLSLARDVCYNIISYEIACECSDLLASIGDDPNKYQQENLIKINHAISSFQNNPNYFENEKSYTMFKRFEIVGKEKDINFLYLINLKLGKPITSTSELHWRLFKIGEQWRIENTKVDKDGNEKIPIMNFTTVSSTLKQNIPMKLTGETEDTSIIYSYNFSEGIYTGQEAYINRAIAKLEYRFDPRKYTQVHKFLKTQLPYMKKLENKNLIAVNNGVFNKVNKKLEPFNPNYFITSKLATNYNTFAINNYLVIRDNYFDVDKWFLSIANGDKELVKVLWEIVNEATNPNHTREKMAILYGEGNNGKGTFQTMLINLIGIENISTLTPHEFSGEFKLEMLQGKVCNIGDDISNKYLDDMSNLMSIVTGDPVAVNRKGKSVITARFKLFNLFSANKLPKVRNKSQGTYRRLLIVPFNADFNGQVQDRRIKDEYLKNSTILEYILYTALHLDFEKFSNPRATERMLEEYKEDNDYIYSFVKDWYIHRNLPLVGRVPLPLVKSEFYNYLSSNYFDYKITGSFGKDIVTHLNMYYKEDGYKYKIERAKIRTDDRRGITKSLPEVEYSGKIPDNSIHCIVKIQ
ncbi:phage/plasmid primase, P4 family [Gemella sanguinis]|uniref:DNA primase family protein n=1 Tax=Gemella sanguinis TaxID=84135 RepID=UPI00352E4D63